MIGLQVLVLVLYLLEVESYCCWHGDNAADVCGSCTSFADTSTDCGYSKSACLNCNAGATWCGSDEEPEPPDGLCCWYGELSDVCGTCTSYADENNICARSETKCKECSSTATWCTIDDVMTPTIKPTEQSTGEIKPSTTPTMKPTEQLTGEIKPSTAPTEQAPPSVPTGIQNNCLSAKDGNVWLNEDKKVYFKGISWFGGETDVFAPHGLWSGKHVDEFIEFMTANGFNILRYPTAVDTVLTNPAVREEPGNAWMYNLKALDVLEYIIDRCGEYGMLVMLDMHRYEHTTWPDDGTFGGWGQDAPGETRVKGAWQILASRFKDKYNVVMADLANEPHGSGWATNDERLDWNEAAERIGNAILDIAPHWLIVVEGVDGSPGCPIQSSPYNHWWGGNLECALEYPINLNIAHRVILSPHVYGPDVFQQPYFDQNLYPDMTHLPQVWDSHFGFILNQHDAPPIIPGEWGGSMQNVNEAWMLEIASYFNDKLMQGMPGNFFWCLNPNSGDTGGLLLDDWDSVDNAKLNLLHFILPSGTDIANELKQCTSSDPSSTQLQPTYQPTLSSTKQIAPTYQPTQLPTKQIAPTQSPTLANHPTTNGELSPGQVMCNDPYNQGTSCFPSDINFACEIVDHNQVGAGDQCTSTYNIHQACSSRGQSVDTTIPTCVCDFGHFGVCCNVEGRALCNHRGNLVPISAQQDEASVNANAQGTLDSFCSP